MASSVVGFQSSLFARDQPGVSADADVVRRELSPGSWVDIVRSWWGQPDELAVSLIGAAPWKQRRRRMYDRVLPDPRLCCGAASLRSTEPALESMRCHLAGRYGHELTAPFLNYYRDGRDSVAFHGDRELVTLNDTIVAIVTLGATRPFLLRPRGGGASIDLRPSSGDLLVMGGRCQRDWEHAVPKANAVGPRVSVSMRWSRGMA